MVHWRNLGDGLYATDLILVGRDGVVLDLFALTTSSWATSFAITVTVSNLTGTQVLVLEAGEVIGPDITTIVGLMGRDSGKSRGKARTWCSCQGTMCPTRCTHKTAAHLSPVLRSPQAPGS